MNQILHRFAWNGIGLIAIVAPLAIGAVHYPARLMLAFLSGAMLLAYALLAFRRGRRIRVDGFVIIGIIATTLMLLQLMPVSDNFLASWSPIALEGLEKARALGYEITGRISLAPAETAEMLVLLGTALCVYIVAANLSYLDSNGPRLLALVGIGGAVIAAVTFIHFLTGSKLILGFYSPAQGWTDHRLMFSTFVNANHAAGFFNLTLFILAGQWQKAQFGKTKGVYAVLVLITALASIAMLSRGGLVALMLGGFFLAAMTRWSGGPRRSSTSVAAMVIGMLLTVAAIGVFMLLFNKVLGKIENTTLFPFGETEGKFLVMQKALDILPSFKSVGAGAGAFEVAFSPYNQLVSRSSFPHVENELIEPLIEFGLPFGLFLLCLPLALLWRRFSFARTDGHYAGALAGLFALGIHNAVDFSLRIPGVLLPAAIALGAITGSFAREREKRHSWRLSVGGLKAIPIAVVIYLLLIAGAEWAGKNDSETVHHRLLTQMSNANLGSQSFETDQGSRLVNLHQHDTHLFSLLAKRLELRDDFVGSRAHYGRAEELCPICVAPRIGLARLEQRLGNQEAMLGHLLVIAQKMPNKEQMVYESVLLSDLSADIIVTAWKDNPELLYRLLRYFFANKYYSRTEELAQVYLEQLGHDVRILNYLGLLYLANSKVKKADAVASKLIGYYTQSKFGFVIQARVFIRTAQLDNALLMYEEALDRVTVAEDVSLSLELMGLLARMRRWDRFESLASDLRLVMGESRQHRAQFHLLMAIREEMRGEYFAALLELDQAENSTPYNIQVPLRKAKLQLLLGRPGKSVAEYRKALKIDPHSAKAAEGLMSLESSEGDSAPL